jgi:hypothetical protein
VVDAVHAVEDGLLLVVDRRRDDDGLGAGAREALLFRNKLSVREKLKETCKKLTSFDWW